MPTPRYEVLSGTIDGANTSFTVSIPYQAGSSAVFINGVLMRLDLDDGWIETDPAAGLVNLKEAPRVGPSGDGCPDVLQMFFLDTSPAQLEQVTSTLVGTIEPHGDLTGSLSPEVTLVGALETPSLEGMLASQVNLCGVVEGEVGLIGTLVVCP